MIPRLYISTPLGPGIAVPLSQEQTHYLKNVLRREVGGELRLFNGSDGEYCAEITELKKRGGMAVAAAQSRPQLHEPDLMLCFAPVKRGPLEVIIQKATEIGVTHLVPVLTERTIAPRLNVERLQAIATEAAEQSGRLSIPSVDKAIKLPALLSAWDHDRQLIFCDEAGDNENEEWGGSKGRAAPLLETLNQHNSKAKQWAILTGPEGGFSTAERKALRAVPSVVPVTLGPRILRADTAAIVAVALWHAACGDWRQS